MTLDLDFKVMGPIDAMDVLYGQLTRDLFAIAKFLSKMLYLVPFLSYLTLNDIVTLG